MTISEFTLKSKDEEPVRRLEIFTGSGRRREWPPEEKARIVAESYEAGETVCAWHAGMDFPVQIVLAHQAPNLLVIDDKALLPQGGVNATVAIAFEYIADFEHGFDNCRVVGRPLRAIIIGRTRNAHQPGIPARRRRHGAGDNGCSPASRQLCAFQSPL